MAEARDGGDRPHRVFIVQLLQLNRIGWRFQRLLVQGPVNASGDEERVQPRSRRAQDVRPHAVADREHATLLDRRASNLLSKRQRLVVNRRIRLAGVDHRAAELLVSARERSRAIDESVAAVDHDVRIGADHRHAASRHRPQFRLVIIQRFGLVVSEAGAQGILGVFEGNEFRPRAGRLRRGVEEAQVALRPDMEDLVAVLLPPSSRSSRRPR